VRVASKKVGLGKERGSLSLMRKGILTRGEITGFCLGKC